MDGINNGNFNGSIYRKLIAVQKELKVPKTLYNSFGKYNYRSAEGILEAVKPILEKNSLLLFITDDVEVIGTINILDKDRKTSLPNTYICAKATLIDSETGEQITTHAYAKECEHKGMSGDQCTGTASSYARKYCLNALFLLDDTKDSDTDEMKNIENNYQQNYNQQNYNNAQQQNNGYNNGNGYSNYNNNWNQY